MAEVEVPSLLESLAGDTRRCAAVGASDVRRRGDRRRVAVRAMATGSTLALVGATAGTAYAVGNSPGAESVITPAAHHASPSPVPRLSATPEPLPSKHRLHHELRAARRRLALHRHRRDELHARHRAGTVTGQRYHERLAMLQAKIARDRKRIAVIKAELREYRHGQHPAAVNACSPCVMPTPTQTAAVVPAPAS